MADGRNLLPKIPESVAVIEETWRPNVAPAQAGASSDPRFRGDDKLIILIQDAHTNPSAQLNIAKILDYVIASGEAAKQSMFSQRSPRPPADALVAGASEYVGARNDRIQHVFLEAGTGDDSLSGLRELASPEKTAQVAKSFLMKGWIQGPDYLDLTSRRPFALWGVEDKELYFKGLEIYRSLRDKRDNLNAYLDKVDRAVQTLKAKLYNPSLLAFDEKKESFGKNNIPLTEYFEILISEARNRDLPLESFPHLVRLKGLKEMESRIDFKKANEEQVMAVQSFSEEDREVLRDAQKTPSRLDSQDRAGDRAFYALLEEVIARRSPQAELSLRGGAKGADEAISSGSGANKIASPLALLGARNDMRQEHPELAKYFAYLKRSRQLDSKAVLLEMDSLEEALFNLLARSHDEAVLVGISKSCRTIRKLLNLTLGTDEFETLKREPDAYDMVRIAGFLNRKIMDLGSHYEDAVFLDEEYEKAFKEALEFYSLTLERDQAFVRNMLAKMNETGQDKAALVVGGFHATHLKKLFRQMNISYVTVMPQVLYETNQKRYEKLLLDQLAQVEHTSSRGGAPSTTLRAGSGADVAISSNPAHWGVLPGAQLEVIVNGARLSVLSELRKELGASPVIASPPPFFGGRSNLSDNQGKSRRDSPPQMDFKLGTVPVGALGARMVLSARGAGKVPQGLSPTNGAFGLGTVPINATTSHSVMTGARMAGGNVPPVTTAKEIGSLWKAEEIKDVLPYVLPSHKEHDLDLIASDIENMNVRKGQKVLMVGESATYLPAILAALGLYVDVYDFDVSVLEDKASVMGRSDDAVKSSEGDFYVAGNLRLYKKDFVGARFQPEYDIVAALGTVDDPNYFGGDPEEFELKPFFWRMVSAVRPGGTLMINTYASGVLKIPALRGIFARSIADAPFEVQTTESYPRLGYDFLGEEYEHRQGFAFTIRRVGARLAGNGAKPSWLDSWTDAKNREARKLEGVPSSPLAASFSHRSSLPAHGFLRPEGARMADHLFDRQSQSLIVKGGTKVLEEAQPQQTFHLHNPWKTVNNGRNVGSRHVLRRNPLDMDQWHRDLAIGRDNPNFPVGTSDVVSDFLGGSQVNHRISGTGVKDHIDLNNSGRADNVDLGNDDSRRFLGEFYLQVVIWWNKIEQFLGSIGPQKVTYTLPPALARFSFLYSTSLFLLWINTSPLFLRSSEYLNAIHWLWYFLLANSSFMALSSPLLNDSTPEEPSQPGARLAGNGAKPSWLDSWTDAKNREARKLEGVPSSPLAASFSHRSSLPAHGFLRPEGARMTGSVNVVPLSDVGDQDISVGSLEYHPVVGDTKAVSLAFSTGERLGKVKGIRAFQEILHFLYDLTLNGGRKLSELFVRVRGKFVRDHNPRRFLTASADTRPDLREASRDFKKRGLKDSISSTSSSSSSTRNFGKAHPSRSAVPRKSSSFPKSSWGSSGLLSPALKALGFQLTPNLLSWTVSIATSSFSSSFSGSGERMIFDNEMYGPLSTLSIDILALAEVTQSVPYGWSFWQFGYWVVSNAARLAGSGEKPTGRGARMGAENSAAGKLGNEPGFLAKSSLRPSQLPSSGEAAPSGARMAVTGETNGSLEMAGFDPKAGVARKLEGAPFSPLAASSSLPSSLPASGSFHPRGARMARIAGSLEQQVEEFGGTDNASTTKFPQHKQVIVPGDNIAGMSGNRAVQNRVVFGIPANGDVFGGFDNDGQITQHGQKLATAGSVENANPFSPTENAAEFGQEGFRNDKIEFTDGNRRKDGPSTPPTQKGAKECVSVYYGPHRRHVGQDGPLLEQLGRLGGFAGFSRQFVPVIDAVSRARFLSPSGEGGLSLPIPTIVLAAARLAQAIIERTLFASGSPYTGKYNIYTPRRPMATARLALERTTNRDSPELKKIHMWGTVPAGPTGARMADKNWTTPEFYQRMKFQGKARYRKRPSGFNLVRFYLAETRIPGHRVVPKPQALFRHSKKSGLVAQVDEGDYVILTLGPKQKGAVASHHHFDCHGVSIRARKNGKVVLGHAHIWPVEVGRQYFWILDRLSRRGYTNIQIALEIDSRLDGFEELTLQDLIERTGKYRDKQDNPVTLSGVLNRNGGLTGMAADVVNTPKRLYIRQGSVLTESKETTLHKGLPDGSFKEVKVSNLHLQPYEYFVLDWGTGRWYRFDRSRGRWVNFKLKGARLAGNGAKPSWLDSWTDAKNREARKLEGAPFSPLAASSSLPSSLPASGSFHPRGARMAKRVRSPILPKKLALHEDEIRGKDLNATEAAGILGVSYRTILKYPNLMRKYGIRKGGSSLPRKLALHEDEIRGKDLSATEAAGILGVSGTTVLTHPDLMRRYDVHKGRPGRKSQPEKVLDKRRRIGAEIRRYLRKAGLSQSDLGIVVRNPKPPMSKQAIWEMEMRPQEHHTVEALIDVRDIVRKLAEDIANLDHEQNERNLLLLHEFLKTSGSRSKAAKRLAVSPEFLELVMKKKIPVPTGLAARTVIGTPEGARMAFVDYVSDHLNTAMNKLYAMDRKVLHEDRFRELVDWSPVKRAANRVKSGIVSFNRDDMSSAKSEVEEALSELERVLEELDATEYSHTHLEFELSVLAEDLREVILVLDRVDPPGNFKNGFSVPAQQAATQALRAMAKKIRALKSNPLKQDLQNIIFTIATFPYWIIPNGGRREVESQMLYKLFESQLWDPYSRFSQAVKEAAKSQSLAQEMAGIDRHILDLQRAVENSPMTDFLHALIARDRLKQAYDVSTSELPKSGFLPEDHEIFKRLRKLMSGMGPYVRGDLEGAIPLWLLIEAAASLKVDVESGELYPELSRPENSENPTWLDMQVGILLGMALNHLRNIESAGARMAADAGKRQLIQTNLEKVWANKYGAIPQGMISMFSARESYPGAAERGSIGLGQVVSRMDPGQEKLFAGAVGELWGSYVIKRMVKGAHLVGFGPNLSDAEFPRVADALFVVDNERPEFKLKSQFIDNADRVLAALAPSLKKGTEVPAPRRFVKWSAVKRSYGIVNRWMNFFHRSRFIRDSGHHGLVWKALMKYFGFFSPRGEAEQMDHELLQMIRGVAREERPAAAWRAIGDDASGARMAGMTRKSGVDGQVDIQMTQFFDRKPVTHVQDLNAEKPALFVDIDENAVLELYGFLYLAGLELNVQSIRFLIEIYFHVLNSPKPISRDDHRRTIQAFVNNLQSLRPEASLGYQASFKTRQHAVWFLYRLINLGGRQKSLAAPQSRVLGVNKSHGFQDNTLSPALQASPRHALAAARMAHGDSPDLETHLGGAVPVGPTGTRRMALSARGFSGVLSRLQNFFLAVSEAQPLDGARLSVNLTEDQAYIFQFQTGNDGTKVAVAGGIRILLNSRPGRREGRGAGGIPSIQDLRTMEEAVTREVAESLAHVEVDNRSVVVDFNLDIMGNPSFKFYLDLFVLGARLAKSQSYGKNVLFRLSGKKQLVAQALSYPLARDLFVTEIPEEFKGAPVVSVAPSNYGARMGMVNLPVNALAEGDVPAFRALIQLAIYSGRIDISNIPQGYYQAYVLLAAEKPEDAHILGQILEGKAELAIIMRYALKALTTVPINQAVQFFRMVKRMVEQAA